MAHADAPWKRESAQADGRRVDRHDEPDRTHCGTDLGLVKTKAVPQMDGSYAITGRKISSRPASMV